MLWLSLIPSPDIDIRISVRWIWTERSLITDEKLRPKKSGRLLLGRKDILKVSAALRRRGSFTGAEVRDRLSARVDALCSFHNLKAEQSGDVVNGALKVAVERDPVPASLVPVVQERVDIGVYRCSQTRCATRTATE
jgi:hypothetical protein